MKTWVHITKYLPPLYPLKTRTYVYLTVFLLFIGVSFSYKTNASRSLSSTQIYERCYSQFVRNVLPDNDSLLIQVRNQKLHPVDACIQLLEKANIQSNGRIANTNDTVAKAILKTMNDFHFSWFTNRSNLGSGSNACRLNVTNSIYDNTEPALHISRTLFNNQAKYSEILTHPHSIRAIRTNANPDGSPMSSIAGYAKANFTYGRSTLSNNHYTHKNVPAGVISYIPRGELLGFTNSPNITIPGTSNRQTTPVNLNASLGGGIIGTQVFLQMNIREPNNFRADGGFHMARNWSQAVLTDLLCRDIPAVREGDASPFVRPNSNVNFRGSARCVACHTTLDRMAGVIRHVEYDVSSNQCFTSPPNQRTGNPAISSNYINRHPASQPAAQIWPDEGDSQYHLRPTQGVLYYRSYDGRLINRTINNVTQLGAALAEENDLYVCAAKRYYNFMTGINVSLRDLGDPFQPVQLSEVDMFHRNQVIDLGLKLKEHQDLQKLIRDIMELPVYQQANFGLN